MPIPATSGQFRTRFEDMQIGDFIACKCVGAANTAPTFSDMGTPLAIAQANEIPITGTAAPNGYFYFNKSDKGLYIADRPVQHSISWDVLNTAKYIQGKLITPYKLSSYSADGYTVSCTSEKPADGNPAWKAFDRGSGGGDCWATANGTTTGSLVLRLPYPMKFFSYDLQGESSQSGWTPSDFTIQGSEDREADINADWTVIDTVTGNLGSLTGKPIKSPAYFSAYKIKVSRATGNANIAISILDFHIGLLRSLSGGNAYLSADGKISLSDQGLGAFPPNNEWDKYIVKSNLGGKISAGDDNVWHFNIDTAVQDTPINGLLDAYGDVGNSFYRNRRGDCGNSNKKAITQTASSGVHSVVGFRPIFQLLEPNSKASNLFY